METVFEEGELFQGSPVPSPTSGIPAILREREEFQELITELVPACARVAIDELVNPTDGDDFTPNVDTSVLCSRLCTRNWQTKLLT